MSPSLEMELKNICEQGYALDLEEAEVGLNCLALPLRQQGRVVAALGIAGPAWRLTRSRIWSLLATANERIFGNSVC